MFIKEITLKNFQNLKTGIGVDMLHIDFTKQKNPVCIIIGANGRGKTSLLSYLTPFATVGDLDIRNSSRPIIKGKEGYKKIILKDDERNEYEIEHFYTPKSDGSFTTKSYFKMNGTELNQNGNVNSFKDLVEEYLDIDISYLKLIRMGDNVKNLISSKSTERKTFAAKILEEVDWYLKKYKDVVQEEKNVKAVIGHIIDEIKKTNIDTKENAQKEIKELEEKHFVLQEAFEDISKKRTEISHDIDKLEIKEDFRFLYKSAKKKLESFNKALETAKRENLTLKSAEKKETDLEKEVVKVEGQISSYSSEISLVLKEIDSNLNEIDEIKIKIRKEEDESNISSLEEYQKKLLVRKNTSYRTAFDQRRLPCTKEEMEEFLVFIKNIQNHLNITYEFGKQPIKEVLKEMKKKHDIPVIITSSLLALEARENAEKLSLIERIINKYAGVKITCKEECPLKFLQEEIMEIKDAVPVTEVKFTQEFYHMMKLAYDNLTSIFSEISDKKSLIEKMPEDVKDLFLTDVMYKKIGNGELIFDEKVLNDYLSFLTEKENYEALVKEYENLEKEIDHLKSISKIAFLREQKHRLESKVDKAYELISEKKGEQEEKEEQLSKLHNKLIDLETMIEALTDYEKAKENFEDLDSKDKELSRLTEELQDITGKYFYSSKQLHELESELQSKKMKLERFDELMESLEVNRIKFEDYTNLKFALSGTTGIPIEHIKNYFKEIRDIANELLDIVYNGELSFGKFKINESEFRMPYIKNGEEIEDASCASQGEASFFNMAISSALRAKSMTRYNIALYDEVDSMFDDRNRQRFIPVLEKQLEINSVRQAFLITHNLMFRQYPVDIINLDDLEASTLEIEFS